MLPSQTFNNNQAADGNGGAINAEDNGLLEITD